MGIVTGLAKRAARKSIFWVIGRFIALVASALVGWIGDLPWLVRPPAVESPFERAAQKWSYFFYCVLPLGLIYIFDYKIVLPAVIFMAGVVTLHRMGAVGVPLWPRRFAKTWTRTLKTPLHWTALLAAGFGAPLAFGSLHLPGEKTSLYVAYATWLVVSHWVAISASRHTLEDRELKARHAASLAVVLKVGVSQITDAGELHMEHGKLVLFPCPPAASSDSGVIEEGLARVLPAWELDAKTTSPMRRVFVPTSLETGDRRSALAESAGLLTATVSAESVDQADLKTKTVKLPAGIDLATVEGHAKFHALVAKKVGPGWNIQEVRDGKAVLVHGTAAARPSAAVWKLAAGTGEKEAAVKATTRAESMGLSLVAWNFDRRQAVVANTLPVVRRLCARLAAHLGCLEHEIELALTFATDDAGHGILETVEILRIAKGPNGDQEKRLNFWLDVARTVVGGSGWKVTEDAHRGRVTLIHGVPRVLPAVVPAASVLPAQMDTRDWATFGIGQSATGKPVTVNLKAGPHMLCVGGTGSGKTVAMRAVILNALARGFEVVIIDPTKKAAGLKGITPWTKGIFTDSVEQAAAAMTAIYDEVRRRVDAIDAVHGENWMDLPKGSVKPILVIVDEYASLVEVDKKPVGLPTDSPEIEDWNRQAAAAALISSRTGKIAREARSAGVHLLLGVQRPDASVVGGAVRENLGTILQMVVPSRPPSPEALGMVFPSEFKTHAMEEVAELNDGRSPGFALSYTEGGALEGFRVAFVDKDDMAEYAERLGIPHGVPLRLPYFETGDSGTTRSRSFGVKSVSQPVVVELGAMEFSLDDLEFEAPATPPTVEAFDLDPFDAGDVGVVEAVVDEDPDPFDEAPLSAGRKRSALVIQDDGSFDEAPSAKKLRPALPELVDHDNPFA